MLVNPLPFAIGFDQDPRDPIDHLEGLSISRSSSQTLDHCRVPRTFGGGKDLQVLEVDFGVRKVGERVFKMLLERATTGESKEIERNNIVDLVERLSGLGILVEITV